MSVHDVSIHELKTENLIYATELKLSLGLLNGVVFKR